MGWSISPVRAGTLLAAFLAMCAGCGITKQRQAPPTPLATTTPAPEAEIVLASHVQESDSPHPLPPLESTPAEVLEAPAPTTFETLPDLEAWALGANPTLRRMQQEAGAAWAKADYADKLPDPSVGAMGFAPPMHYEPDRQLAEMEFMQMIPWLGRLKAEARQAQMEAMAAENDYRAERLRVIGELRADWFKLYVLGKQIEITEADKAQLESLIRTANARIATGDGQPGDVLMATLELSSLQEQLLGYRQQVAATTADINRLLGRDAQTPITPPASIEASLPPWDHEMLRGIAFGSQPELIAAQLRTAATRWGIEVARLQRRPDITFGATWMIMDDPGRTGEAGRDTWILGATTTLPIWHRKYDAMVSEASREHFAAHASVDEVAARLDALLRDLWEQALASQKTVELYEQSILPQARQTFAADQQSLANNTVTFDRVIRDYRTLLSLQLGYHRALAQLATTLARIRQTIGVDLAAETQ
jgi:outer membrane protein TolC